MVERTKCISEDQFTRDWALCQMAPGINLMAFAILLGKQAAGFRGVLACIVGLLFPSILLTVALTAAYVAIRDYPAVQFALKGILPGTVGLGLLTAFQMGRKPVEDANKSGKWELTFAVFLLVSSALLLYQGSLSVTAVLIAASVVGAIEGTVRSRMNRKAEA